MGGKKAWWKNFFDCSMTSIKRDRVVTRNLTADESTYVVQAKVYIKAKSEVKRKKGGRGKQVIKELFTYRRVQSNRPGTRRWLSRLSASGKDHALRLKPLEVLIARTVDLSKIILPWVVKLKSEGLAVSEDRVKRRGCKDKEACIYSLTHELSIKLLLSVYFQQNRFFRFARK